MTSTTTTSSLALVPSLEIAWQDVDSSFERFCLTAGIGAIEQMLCEDAQQLAGALRKLLRPHMLLNDRNPLLAGRARARAVSRYSTTPRTSGTRMRRGGLKIGR